MYKQHNMKIGLWHGSAEQQLPDAYIFRLKQHDLKKWAKYIERYGNETLAIKRRLAVFTTVVATNPRVISEAILDEFDRDMTAAATSPYNITVHLPERHRSQQT